MSFRSEKNPMSIRLLDHKVLTFDCYGTLIDWESGIWDALQPLIASSGRADVTRQAALVAFAHHESQHQLDTPDLLYPDLLARVHQSMANDWGMATTTDLDETFGGSVPHWPAFPDTADALRYLKANFKLVILSNVNQTGFAASNRKLGVAFDAIYTAEDVGSYKPNPANFEFMLKHLESDFGLRKSDILHTAQSLFHDHAQAKSFGLANVWIDRQRLSETGDWGATAELSERPATDRRFFSMAEMADAVAAEVA